MARPILQRYAFAALASAAAVALRVALGPLLGQNAEFIFEFVALLVVGLYAGIGPSILALLLGLAGTWFVVMPPVLAFLPLGADRVAALAVYAAAGLACALMGNAAGRARRHAESNAEALRASQHRLAGLLGSIPDAFYSLDRDWRFSFVNEQLVTRMGRSASEVLGRTVWELLPDTVGGEADVRLHEAMTNRVTVQYELFHRPSQRWFLERAYPTPDAGLAVYSIDITDSKRLEDALASQLAVTQAIADNTTVLLTRCTRDLRYAFVNRAYAEFLKLPRERIASATIESVVGKGVLDVIRPHIERVLAGETVEYEAEVPYERLGARFVHVRYVPDRDPSGTVQGWFASIQDITQRKEIESRVAEADRRKDEFMATLAHELRNPLAPIRTSLEIMERAAGDPALVEQARTTMARQLKHVERLVDDLLDLSRISRGRLQLNKTRVSLASIVHIAVESMRGRLGAADQDLTVTLPSEPVHLEADPARLTQVLTNLIDNASKYSAPKSRIRVGAEQDAKDTVIWVEDDGPGIPRDQLDRIFDAFTQVGRTLETTQRGLGIGLALVKKFVELHGGIVTVHSDESRGSKFVVRLPAFHETAPSREPNEGRTSEAVVERRRILVVDDNADAAVTLTTLLRMIGHDVEAAHDGIQAVTRAESFRPDIILLDIGLPELNGYDACRAIRQQPWGKQMFIVALTGWGQEKDRRMAQEAGFDDHLVKPVGFAALEKYWPRMRAERGRRG